MKWKWSQGQWNWYEQLKLSKYYKDARFNTDHFMSGEDILNVKLLFFMAKRIGRQPISYHYIDSFCFKRVNGDIKADFCGERPREL